MWARDFRTWRGGGAVVVSRAVAKAHVPAHLELANVPYHALCILRSTTLITGSIIPCAAMCLCTLHCCFLQVNHTSQRIFVIKFRQEELAFERYKPSHPASTTISS